MCAADENVCGLGRVCTDWAPPTDPSTVNAPATTCSACLPGYTPSPAFTLTLEDYELAISTNRTAGRDCEEYDACAATPPPCYNCGSCPPGMTGSGEGPAGCEDIDSCADDPCDSIALECVDLTAPLDGFLCTCPAGTVGRETGNHTCVDVDSCQNGNNSCMFPHLCTDLPYTSHLPYACSCPVGMYLINERSCKGQLMDLKNIDGCVSIQCRGSCTDVPYNHPLITMNPGSNGTEAICEECPHGTVWSTVGKDGCQEINLCETSSLADLLCYNNTHSTTLSAACVDVRHGDLLPADPNDLYRCVCPPGMTGEGFGPSGCKNIDYCHMDACGENEVCVDYDPPFTGYSCRCAQGYTRDQQTSACVDASYCQGHYRPCDPRMLCTELPPPAQKSSDYFPIVHCTSCPKGTVGPDKVVYLVNGSVLEPAKCEEINGCEYNDTCWVNPVTRKSLCEDVPSALLKPWHTGYEVYCGSCPHGMRGGGNNLYGQKGCEEINGCETNRCFVGVECIDISWYKLTSTQKADEFLCGPCPGDLEGDGRTCLGGCDFESSLCDGAITGSTGWYREKGSINYVPKHDIDKEPRLGSAPLYDHTHPYTSKGYYLTVDVSKMADSETSAFTLPVIRGPASVRVLFHAVFSGEREGVLYVRQLLSDGTRRTVWLNGHSRGSGWFGVESIYVLSNQDFSISFEFQKHNFSTADITPPGLSTSAGPQLYVALDDIIIHKYEDFQCNHNQLCSGAAFCMGHADAAIEGKGYTCFCNSGYTGEYCETKEDNSLCQHEDNSLCQRGGSSSPDTSCEEYGQSCTASQHICRYGGTCVNLPAGARCTCAPGFTGKYCEVNVADCAEVDCGNGRCYDLVASYLCVCQGGWRGVGCDISEQQCSPSPCLRGAQCVDSGGSFQCLCPAGFTGRVCETDINECQDICCQQGADCVDLIADFLCDCPAGFSGKRCETDTDECAGNPCSGHGQCYEGIEDAACLCTQPDCRDHADCAYKPGRHLCHCESGYTGSSCELIIDYCHSNPCVHGNCEAILGGFTCTCSPGWQGTKCEWEVDACKFAPCLNSGNCLALMGDFKCFCVPGFEGISAL
ncbi:hypothetical protein EB796_002134 [Bugula neritina]|uniref:Uncharacterized protein n=1 Tax=Bugula neritina TaxID=10212 RepID=A0A7J7KN33_BUGNE|nr:hypothetical protein EB796_002134 [Bugula neritina]